MIQFYSYMWLREDGTPYYVGKGQGRRAFIRKNHRLYPPKDKSRILVFSQECEADAFESEVALIDLFGRKDLDPTGLLRNLTEGGEGTTGLKYPARSQEHLRKMREVNLGHPDYSTPEGIAKSIATKRTPEMRAMFSEQMKAVWARRRGEV